MRRRHGVVGYIVGHCGVSAVAGRMFDFRSWHPARRLYLDPETGEPTGQAPA